MAARIIKSRLEDYENDPLTFATISLDNQYGTNFLRLNVILLGPSNTPYEGGKFELEISNPEELPFKSPRIKFLTKIFHPNILPSGNLCNTCIETWSRKVRNLLEHLYNDLIYPGKKCRVCDPLGIYGIDAEEYKELTTKWIQAKFNVGDKITVLEDGKLLENLNKKPGPPVAQLRNKTGKIIEITNHGYTIVDFDGEKWDLNSLCLVREEITFKELNISLDDKSKKSNINCFSNLFPVHLDKVETTPEESYISSTDNDIKYVISEASIVPSPQINMNFIEDTLLRYFNNNQYTDITFKVKNGSTYKYFRCHKLVLSMCSPILADELSIVQGNVELEILDISKDVFEVLIKYCYGLKEDLKNNCKNINFILNILKAARKYGMKSLEDSSYIMLNSVIPNTKNVFDLIEAARLTKCDHLKLRCYKVLQTQTIKIISSLDMSSVTDKILNTILDMPALSINSDYDLISWIFEWGSYTFKKYSHQGDEKTFKEILDPYLPRLNFLSLTPEEFVQLVKKYDYFFDDKDGFAIIMNIISLGSKNLPVWCNIAACSRKFKRQNSSII